MAANSWASSTTKVPPRPCSVWLSPLLPMTVATPSRMQKISHLILRFRPAQILVESRPRPHSIRSGTLQSSASCGHAGSTITVDDAGGLVGLLSGDCAKR